MADSHKLLLLADMHDMLDSVYEDVEKATRRVFVECYIYRDGKLGTEFGDRMAAAAARGCDVRLLYDPLGSNKAEDGFFAGLDARGVKTRSYRHIGAMRGLGSIAPRDHSRVIVADDMAYTGGAAWSDEWLPEDRGGKGWHDVCCRVDGPVTKDFAALFEKRWAEAISKEEPGDYDTAKMYEDLRLVADSPHRVSLVYERFREACERATKRIWVAIAYFYPSDSLLEAMKGAAARGADVRVLLPCETDLPIVKRAAQADYLSWMDAGFRIFEYDKNVMHSKYAVIDDDWCSVGTFNANPISVGMSNEVNLFVYRADFVGKVAAQFERDLSLSHEITREAAADRSLGKRIGDKLRAGAMHVVDKLVGPRD